MTDTAASLRPLSFDEFYEGLSQPQPTTAEGPQFVQRLLQEQRELTAVEEFSRAHAAEIPPDQSRYYSRLLPATPPGPGEQYAFEVDLDRCSGCKACVTACHSLNGLDQGETWRDVGLLVGGTEAAPMLQHVTAACHHCLEPACMLACPVNAYEKDPFTGIVKHLDDQCFGCQYCTLACPYNVPKYHAAKGIVRKCDLCSTRLQRGEAPACVQACPHEAIAIQIVSTEQVIADSEANHFLPAAPEPSLTLPTTTYKTQRVFPRNMLPADYHAISPEHPHWPLIVMLVLTQLSVGAFTTGWILDASLDAAAAATLRPVQSAQALVFGLLALAASTFHLGRPLYAWRGILGIRHSWLSREILAFGLFAGLAVPYAWACREVSQPWLSSPAVRNLLAEALFPVGGVVVLTGLVGVFCSAMIYVFTRRELWSLERTLSRFLLTAALLGVTSTWLTLLMLSSLLDATAVDPLIAALKRPLTWTVCGVAALKLLVDLSVIRYLADVRMTSLKRTALLLTGSLSNVALARVGLGVLGGLLLPFILLSESGPADQLPTTSAVSVLLMWAACLGGELLERYLFFAAVSAPRMPGGVRP